MAEPEHLLFVSHVTEDRPAALDIVEELEGRGIPCWIAPRNIHPGRLFDDEIVAAIASSRAILLIFSDLCNESEYIRRQLAVAGESRKPVIPLRIEDAQPRRGLRARLSDLDWLDAFAGCKPAIDELVRRFGPVAAGLEPRLAEAGEPAARGAAPRIAAPPASGRHAILALALLPAAVLVGAVGWWWSGGLRKPAVPAAVAASKGKAAFERHDYREALHWDRQAAAAGDVTAQTTLGYLYEKGLGVPQSYPDALAWYLKAAALGHAAAERNIGALYERGHGVPQDYAAALVWYRRAAARGNADAEYKLALLYADGHGVPADLAEARSWMQKAAGSGDPEARKWLQAHGG